MHDHGRDAPDPAQFILDSYKLLFPDFILAVCLLAAAAIFAVAYRDRHGPIALTLTQQHRWQLSSHGFLMAGQAEKLPPKFDAWEATVARLPELNRAGQLHAEIGRLPCLSIASEELSAPALRRARVILTYLVHSYMFGHLVPWQQLDEKEGDPCARFAFIPLSDAADASAASRSTLPPPPPPPQQQQQLPPQLATPWRQVSSLLQMPLVLTVTDADLWNAAPGLESLPPSEWIAGFRQLISFTSTRSERGFHAVPHAINRALAPLVPRLLAAPDMARRNQRARLASLLEDLAAGLGEAKEHLESIYREVDVGEFYDFYRFLLGGWAPEGLKLPVAPEHGLEEELVVLVGPSAGQTAVLILVDLVLGVSQYASSGSNPGSATALVAPSLL